MIATTRTPIYTASDILLSQHKNEGLASSYIFFHGAGGDAEGKIRNPNLLFNIELAIDLNYWANQTFVHNFPETHHVLMHDISKFELEYNKKVTLDFSLGKLQDLHNQRVLHDTETLTINFQNLETTAKTNLNKWLPIPKLSVDVKRFIDVIFMSPPCQEDSILNKHESKDVNSIKGLLAYETFKFIEACLPEIIVFENVTSYSEHKKKAIAKHLHKLGYNGYWQDWTSSLFGSVQDRKRLFGFFKLAGKMKFPKLPKQHSKLLKHVLQSLETPSGFNTSPSLLADFPNVPVGKWFRANASSGSYIGEDRFYYVKSKNGNYIPKESTSENATLYQLNGKKYEVILNPNMIDHSLTQQQLIFNRVKRGQGEFIRKKKHDNAYRYDYNGRAPTVLNAVRNWLVHASGLRVVTVEEIQAISGLLESFLILSGGSKFRHCQMLTDLIDPFQSEYNGLVILLNLDKITESKANYVIDTIPDRAMDLIPSWSNPNQFSM